MKPDYTVYTIDELLEAKSCIDADKYPENYERLINELKSRDIVASTPKPTVTVSSFEKVGKVLIVIGIIDIVAMVLVIANGNSYSSSFNIIAIIIGYLLYKSSVRTAYIARWISVFAFVSYILGIFLYTLILPFELSLIYLKLIPGQIFVSAIFVSLFLAIFLWVYKTLSNNESLEVFNNNKYKTSFPKTAPITSVVLFVAAGAFIFPALKGETAEKAINLAKQQYGKQYNYHLSSIKYSGDSGSAIITVYGNDQAQNIQVTW